ncbi:uncharacterized protein HGUI_03645 [Hanseniaspora guilliermondii]|uniref:RING-type domain-containing protein n=1 Tax=Hanseniaspora guilliermondii TaxID=56406 RepID=A0A1L0B6I3_9ASCO|nr:uncharacterized protein HGUI_03645 [Hanseniaspora guilliermondii]
MATEFIARHYKLFYGLLTYASFGHTLINALTNCNNSLQLLLLLFSSNNDLFINDNNSAPVYNLSYLVTLNFILFNSYIFVNTVLIKWVLFGELRLIEIQNINARIISTVVNEIIMFVFFMNAGTLKDDYSKRDIKKIVQESKSNLNLDIMIYVMMSISMKMIHWINLERLKMIYSRFTNENNSQARNNDDYAEDIFTGNSLEEDKNQLKVKNIYFIMKFYQSRYFLILLILTLISFINAWKFNMAKNSVSNFAHGSEILTWLCSLFFTLMSIKTTTTWCFSVVNLVDAYKLKCQQDNTMLKLRESMRQINKVSGNEENNENETELSCSDNEEDIDDDDEGIFGYNDTFEQKYRIELMISLANDVLHITARVLIAYTKSKMSALSLLISNEMLAQIHSTVVISKNLMSIYEKYEQLQELPSPTELECVEDDTCIICMDTLYPTKSQLNLALKKYKVKADDSIIKEALIKYKPKILPCGHYLHMHCLKSWFERSKSCPMCRMDIFDPYTGRIRSSVFYKSKSNLDKDGEVQATNNEDTLNPHSEDTAKSNISLNFDSNDQPNISMKSCESHINEDRESYESDDSFEYKDLHDNQQGQGYCIFYFSKSKIPVYENDSKQLTIGSYHGYKDETSISLRHNIKPSSYYFTENKQKPNKKHINIEIDTSGFIPI